MDKFKHLFGLYATGDFAEAEKATLAALKEYPDEPELWSLLGAIQRATGRAFDAAQSHSRGISYASGMSAGLWANLGNAHLDLNHLQTAATCLQNAVRLRPDDASLHHDLGVILMWGNRPREAAAAFSNTLRLNPAHAVSRLSRAQAWLSLGEFEHGWSDYEARLQIVKQQYPSVLGEAWRGEAYSGKRLLILSEQGHGDAIWASRYFRAVKALGGELVVECQEGLVPLFASMGAVDQFIAKGTALPDTELHTYMCSLPGFFTKNYSCIPNSTYLSADWPDRLSKFKEQFPNTTGHLRVGIVWSGSVTFAANAARTIRLRELLRALAIPNVQLFSLQKGPARDELIKLADHRIVDLADFLNDFCDTAAAISQLDLVVMTDSAIAHLCGAMGKPVWLLLGSAPYWLWMHQGRDSPWYTSVHMFRATTLFEWTSVLDQVALELTRLATQKFPTLRD